jgi:hypothetical protein
MLKSLSKNLFALATLTILIASLVLCVLASSKYPFQSIPLRLSSKMHTVNMPVAEVNSLLFGFEINSEQFIHQFSAKGAYPDFSNFWQLSLLIVALIGIWIALALLPPFPGSVFYPGISLVFLLIYLFRFDLVLFGTDAESLAMWFLPLLLTLPAIIFHISGKHTTHFKRFALFGILVFGPVLWILLNDESRSDLMSLSVEGLSGIMIAILAICVLIAHEIPAFFVEITSRNATEKEGRSLIHFMLINVLYLGSLVLFYLNISERINFDLPYFNAFILLAISVLLGLRSFPFRLQSLGYSISPFETRVLYLGFASIPFAFLAFAFASNNDLLVEALEDAILFSHMGMGLFFILYIIINFLDPFYQNKPVYKVMYKPMRMPYFTAVLMGIMASLVPFYLSGLMPFLQATGGSFVVNADFARKTGQDLLAQQYLEYANGAIPRNHRANYSLGVLYLEKGDEGQALYFFNNAVKKIGGPQAYLNRAVIYGGRDRWFDAFFSLKDGEKEGAEGGLFLELGNYYSQTRVIDSAAWYYQKAAEFKEVEIQAKSNLLFLLAKNELGTISPQPNLSANHQAPIEWFTNNMAIGLQMVADSLALSSADESSLFAYLNNYLANPSLSADVNLDSLSHLARQFSKANQREPLLEKLAFHYYRNHNHKEAFRILGTLAYEDGFLQGKHAYSAALLAISFKNWRLANDFLNRTAQVNFKSDALVIALVQAGLENSSSAFNALSAANSNVLEAQLKEFLKGNINNDTTRYWDYVLQYNSEWLSPSKLGQNFKERAVSDRILNIWSNYSDKFLEEWALNSETEDLGISFIYGGGGSPRGILPTTFESEWQQALQLSQERKMEDAAVIFDRLATAVFYPPIVIHASKFFLLEMRDIDKAYTILQEAISINPYSPALLEAYIFICVDQNLNSYAEFALNRYKSIVDRNTYLNFEQLYYQRINAKNLGAETWD